MPRRNYKLAIENEGSFIMLQGELFAMEQDLADQIVENIQKNILLIACKNCEKPFIRNSPTHMICWRCKSNTGLEEL